MAALIKGLQVAQKLTAKQPLALFTASRKMAGWNKDFKPGKFPETEKDQKAAAAKYNLFPEEYRPYADDGLGYGDYPKLEAGLGAEAKDNYYPYDYPSLKLNFNEPIHADVDLYGEDRYSQAEPPRYKNSYYFLCFGGVMTFFFVLYYWLEDKKMYRPVAVKQYPAEGVVHYTFEPEND